METICFYPPRDFSNNSVCLFFRFSACVPEVYNDDSFIFDIVDEFILFADSYTSVGFSTMRKQRLNFAEKGILSESVLLFIRFLLELFDRGNSPYAKDIVSCFRPCSKCFISPDNIHYHLCSAMYWCIFFETSARDRTRPAATSASASSRRMLISSMV